MTHEEWEEEYVPVKNHLDDNASFDGCMFETYDEEFVHVLRNADDKKVWTYVEGDEGLYLIPGLHFVNRLGYLITEKPYTDETIEVKLD
jgi:hypothetical protein